MRLSENDIDVLKALTLGETPQVMSWHRLRLAMLGLVLDGRAGLSLTLSPPSSMRRSSARLCNTMQ